MRVREIWSDEACREGKAVCASSLCLCICVPYGGRSESRGPARELSRLTLSTEYNYMRIIGRERLPADPASGYVCDFEYGTL